MQHFRNRLTHHISPAILRRRLVLWIGAVVAGLVIVVFALLADIAQAGFIHYGLSHPWMPLIVCPTGLALIAWLTRRFFPGAEGSGIPQTIACIKLKDGPLRQRLLSIRVAFGKVVLTLLGLLSGASIGREGPSVHVGAAVVNSLSRFAEFPKRDLERGLLIAGGAAGVAAAFNTPLAGVVFAIEEISRSFEERSSGTLLTVVIIAGLTSLVVMGDYDYFGHFNDTLPIGAGLAVLTCAVAGGFLGGLFSKTLLVGRDWLAPFAGKRPILLAALCGLAIAVIGIGSGNTTFGTGYEEAERLLDGGETSLAYPFLKMLATLASYWSGIPGGIFAPSLSAGGGLGAFFAGIFTEFPAQAIMVVTMAAFFTGVVQTPITAVIIVMEMTENHTMIVPLMLATLIADTVSKMVCEEPIYRSLARSFFQGQPAPADENPGSSEREPDSASNQDKT